MRGRPRNGLKERGLHVVGTSSLAPVAGALGGRLLPTTRRVRVSLSFDVREQLALDLGIGRRVIQEPVYLGSAYRWLSERDP
jgi:hypothetical protein